MNLEINQSNLYLLLPSKVAWMAEWLSEDKNVSIVEAIKMIYSSDMFHIPRLVGLQEKAKRLLLIFLPNKNQNSCINCLMELQYHSMT